MRSSTTNIQYKEKFQIQLRQLKDLGQQHCFIPVLFSLSLAIIVIVHCRPTCSSLGYIHTQRHHYKFVAEHQSKCGCGSLSLWIVTLTADCLCLSFINYTWIGIIVNPIRSLCPKLNLHFKQTVHRHHITRSFT